MTPPLSFADLSHRRRGRPLGGVLPIIGVIFGLGLGVGAIVRTPSAPSHWTTMERLPLAAGRYSADVFSSQLTYSAEVLRVIDGDTFAARLRVWRGFDLDTKVRLRSIDAPELHARCASEYLKAEAARAALQSIPPPAESRCRTSAPTNIAGASMPMLRRATRLMLARRCSKAAGHAATTAAAAAAGADARPLSSGPVPRRFHQIWMSSLQSMRDIVLDMHGQIE